MKLLRAATVSVANLQKSIDLYCHWLNYTVDEQAQIDDSLAASWGCSAAVGLPYVVLRPASGRDVFIRLVENQPHPGFVPLTSFGWSAIEICVQGVLAANERIQRSPFKIIGPPREIEGLDAIYPMQILGPDNEIIYLTQIRGDLPSFDLPRAEAPIDRLFILVMACSNMDASLEWLQRHAGFDVGRPKLEIVYTMLSKAFQLPESTIHTISTMVHGRGISLELDQMPDQAPPRAAYDNALPQGVAIGSFLTPDFETLDDTCKDLWIQPPTARPSAVYAGNLAATLRAPDNTLVEIISMQSSMPPQQVAEVDLRLEVSRDAFNEGTAF